MPRGSFNQRNSPPSGFDQRTPRQRERVEAVLRGILAEEETHLGVIDQHNALLAADRESLSEEAGGLLDALATLQADDYRHPAAHAVEQVVAMMRRYADPERQRAEIEASAATGPLLTRGSIIRTGSAEATHSPHSSSRVESCRPRARHHR